MDVPNAQERANTFAIHLVKHHRDPRDFDLLAPVRATESFSGAEIEQAVNDGLLQAFHAGREVQTGDIRDAAERTYPLSRTRARQIAELTAWAEMNARPASAA